MQIIPDNLDVVFVGNRTRGARLQEAVQSKGWRFSIVSEKTPALARQVALADLVILDNFPESDLSKSVFYHLRSCDACPFLALTDKPNDLKFFHVNALSSLRIVHRNSEPRDLMAAIVDLLESYHRTHSRKGIRKHDRHSSPERRMNHRPQQACTAYLVYTQLRLWHTWLRKKQVPIFLGLVKKLTNLTAYPCISLRQSRRKLLHPWCSKRFWTGR